MMNKNNIVKNSEKKQMKFFANACQHFSLFRILGDFNKFLHSFEDMKMKNT